MSETIDITQSYGPVDYEFKLNDDYSLLVMSSGDLRFAHTCTRQARLGPQAMAIRCAPALQYGTYGTGHTLVSIDPITITPSILCDDCGAHGFITEGKWVSV